jgi:hypothetical protein
MFGSLFKKDPKLKLQKKYEVLLKESFMLSKSNRSASDRKLAEADQVLKEIDALSRNA